MEIGFIDYSREERNRILSTLELLGKHAALDELGIGVVRDAYADILFPGISTLQTRAKYFVLVPYLFQSAREQAEKGKLRSAQDMMQWIREGEDRLVASLVRNCPGVDGIIGINALRSKRSVKIKPSTIYWSGLRAFGILRGDSVSIASACKLIYAAARRKAAIELKRDGESFDDPTAADQGSVLFLPLKPDYDYENNAVMDLTRKEAEFLRERILTHVPDSLLAFMIDRQMICDDLYSVPEDQLKDGLRRDYHLAKEFSRFIYGAHIRYNVVFSNYTDEDMISAFDAWREETLSTPLDLEPVLARVSCKPDLTCFCHSFFDAVEKNDTAAMDECIIKRELCVKKERSKLRKPEEFRYDPRNRVHDYRLDYRYNRASVIIRDILKGLEGA